jgi:hypothetical protein
MAIFDFGLRGLRPQLREAFPQSEIQNPKSRIGFAAVAQLVEHFLGKEEVKSSSLFSSFGEE